MTKTAVIFGSTGGIGAATAHGLKAKGYTLHLAGRDAARLAALAGELGAGFTAGDAREPSHFADLAATLGDRPVDALVYAVGSINLKPLNRLKDEDFLGDFTLNALGAARAVQALLPALKRSEAASIVLFSTVAVAQGFSAHASVSMAKGAIEGLTRALGAELAPRIRVNCIAPSLTRTKMAAALTGNEAMAKAIAELHAVPRLGQPEDVAGLATFLASAESGWISGQVMAVDGGRSRLRTKG
ncbi:SDR family oxidoreductase [Rhabdaerophilum sp. SD176]|uniref:SDR family NAD(P)-dependent oxidoreductase n=1 Tax=Rhabdaerophilum sp. SD176 TaxID=2983548 RepID=UPI0024E00BC7|nr:SDR family oxidoreductase [Rhabdaerophilum sp. SD176]